MIFILYPYICLHKKHLKLFFRSVLLVLFIQINIITETGKMWYILVIIFLFPWLFLKILNFKYYSICHSHSFKSKFLFTFFCFILFCIKGGALLSLREILASDSPLKMIKNVFYFTLKALFVHKIFQSLLWLR